MKIFRNALLASFLILVWSFVFSSATAPLASAQQDEISQSQAPPPPPDQGQAYDKPDAGRPMEIPNESANGTGNESANETANDLSDQSDQNDPPGRVARLQYLTGSVSVQPHGTADWVQGSVNRPLTIADNVWADKNSRAELNVGTGIIRIGSESSLTLTNVNDNSVQLSLHQGAMNLHVRHLYRGEIYEVDTPNQAFTILKTGDYRFDVDPNADTTLVTVWRGEGESTGQGSSVRVKEHSQARFSSGNSLAHELHNAPRRDGFDDWCQVRDRREDDSVSARYVSPDVIGSEDLDAYGTWRNTPEYGHVWVPTQVDRGWAPYSAGHWIYEDPWGWTWDDDAPWGFAPFHYGRWVSFGAYWGWAPGPYYGGWDRGWYAPALVSWYGGGGWGVGFGFGFGGGFGWCPLGFGEPFFPWYHTGWGYFRNVNIYNTRINNINGFRGGFRNGFVNRGGFRNANINVRGGFTAVSRGTLEHGLPVRGNAVRVNANAIRNAPALSRVNANPTMQSRLGPNAGRPAAGAPARVNSRPVTSRMTPPAASRSSSFGSAQPGANQSAGLQNGRGATSPRLTTAQPNVGAARPANGRSTLTSGNSSMGGRNVPRPPQNFSRSNNSAGANTAFSGNARGLNNSMPNRSAGSGSVQSRSIPRPPAGWAQSRTNSSNISSSNMNSSNTRGGATPQPSTGNSARSGAGSGGFRNNVPRPTGQVMAAPRNYSSGGNSPGYSSRSYGGNSAGRYGSAPQYSGSSRYSGSSQYGGSPYGGRSYGGSQPSTRNYSGPSYGGGGRSAAPSSAGRSYGGGSSSGGGGRSYGGGGGYSGSSRASSGGGGSRGSSGGGSRGSGNSGGRH